MDSNYFAQKLIFWYEENKRNLPWRNNDNPYHIWISEIILQQTRVEQGLGYFNRFINRFPTIEILSKSSEEEVLKLWEGLGYYSRARNLHYASHQIMEHFGGEFPKDYQSILSLKGIGEYTAGAIASFAFNLPHPAVDGNVFRVLSRLFAISTPIDSSRGKKEFTQWAESLQTKDNPAIFNQALIEFGALQCTPNKPDCNHCPFVIECLSRKEGRVKEYPIKQGKTAIKPLFLYYFIMEQNGNYIIEKRIGKGIWRNLYQFPVYESTTPLTVHEAIPLFFEGQPIEKIQLKHYTHSPIHLLSHRRIDAHFLFINVPKHIFEKFPHAVDIDKMDELPFPKLISPIVDTITKSI